MMPYLLHVSLLIAGCYLAYRYLLEDETFFKFNRWLLIGCMVTAFVLPLWEIPADWSLRDKLIVHQQTPVVLEEPVPEPLIEEEPAPEVVPVLPEPSSEPEIFVEPEPSMVPVESQSAIWQRIAWGKLLVYAYLIGLGLFALNWLIQLGAIMFQIIGRPSLRDGRFRIVELEKDVAPYSFFNWICINPGKYEPETYQQIIDHEKIHIDQGHSFDILLAELLVVVQWFNPFAWWYRRAVENNLEYLTDDTMLFQGTKRESYQMSLLKVSVPQQSLGLVTNYNESFLKKRIIMMNKVKSSLRASWKYLSLFAALAFSVLVLNASKQAVLQSGILQVPSVPEVQAPDLPPVPPVPAVPASPGNAIAPVAPAMPATPAMPVAPAIPDVPVPHDGYGSQHMQSSDYQAFMREDMNGDWEAEIRGDKVCIRMEISDKKRRSHWNVSECFDEREFDGLRRGNNIEFALVREAGTIYFSGDMDRNEGEGNFEFVPNNSFRTSLRKYSDESIPNGTMLQFFLANFNREYFQYLADNGYRDLEYKQIKSFAVHRIDLEYLERYLPTLKAYGYRDVSADDLIRTKIHHVRPEYIVAMADAGMEGLSIDDLVKGRIHHLKPEYIGEFQQLGYRDLGFDDYVRFSVHHVKPETVRELKRAGYRNLSADQLVQAKVHHLDLDLIEAIGNTSLEKPSFQQLINMKIHHISADYIRSFEDAGFRDLDWDMVKRAKIHHVSPEFIASMQRLGLDDYSIDDYIKLKIHHVSPEYVAAFKDLGYYPLTINEVQRAKIHHLSPEFIRGLNRLGYRNIPLDLLVNLKIHHVTPDFIEYANDKGYRNLSLEEYKKLKINNIVK